ncbi:MAG: hypothetical protein KTR29_19010 [Rhodothermaceae bacterium]|nr:hypothetical protein [Rhodothermaceae bacterium]
MGMLRVWIAWVLIWTGLMACQPTRDGVHVRVQGGMVYLDNWTPSYDVIADDDRVKLYVWDEEHQAPNKPAVAGKLVATGNGAFAFAPIFPLDKHTSYLLTIDEPPSSFQHLIERSSEPRVRPVVTHIYPSRDSLPENLLRMYIQFSQPMKTIGNLERIRIIDDEGLEVSHAIFNNVHELWNADQTQLTLLFDPARVKTGLDAHEHYGRALRAGRTYTIEVDGLEDVYGAAMDGSFRKSIHVTTEDRDPPSTDRWALDIPEAGSHSPFVVRFPDTIDRLSLLSRLKLTMENSTSVPGEVRVNKDETAWMFIPENPWKKGTYVLHVNARLEDPAGNNLNGLFDHEAGSLLYEEEGVRIPLPFAIED